VKRISSLVTTGIAIVTAVVMSTLALFTAAGSSPVVAQSSSSSSSPEASQASPAAIALPQGALGLQIEWLLKTLNTPANDATSDPIAKHVSPEFLAMIPADKLAADLLALNADLGPFTIKDNAVLTTRDYPPTTAIFVLVGSSSSSTVEVRTSLSIDRDSGLIRTLTFETGANATPGASPVAAVILPSGPLGMQIQWLLDSVNGDPSLITPAMIEAHFTPEYLARVSAADILSALTKAHSEAVPVTIEDGSIITTMDFPPTVSGFVLVAADGSTLQSGIVVDRDSGLINGFSLGDLLPAILAGTPVV